PASRHLLRRLGILGRRRRVLLPLRQEVGRVRLPFLQLGRRERLERAALLLDVGDGLGLEIADPGEIVVHRFRRLVAEHLLYLLRQPRPRALADGDVVAGDRHHITISKRTWARLPKEIQQVFRDQSAKTMDDYLAWVGDFESKAVANIKEKGGTFKPFPAAELKKWKSDSPDFLAQWEKDTAAATKDAETPKKVAARW